MESHIKGSGKAGVRAGKRYLTCTRISTAVNKVTIVNKCGQRSVLFIN